MRLSDYLAHHDISPADFARRIDVSPAAVSRYAAGLRFPEPTIMVRIRAATAGEVGADDFLPSAPAVEPEQAATA